jgi:uncharacterized protein YcbX
MRVGTVSELWRYPVKSMLGERLDSAYIGTRGTAGDRGWAVRDHERGGVTNAKRLPALRACRASYLDEPVDGEAPPHVEITLPGGGRITSDDPRAARLLSEALGRAVSLESIGPAGTPAAARISSSGDTRAYRRRLMGLARGEPEPDMSAFPTQRLIELRKDNFFDALPVHLLTTSTLRTFSRLAPKSVWDSRRFRMTVLVDTDDTNGTAYDDGDFPEQAWIGRRISLGGAVIELTDPCPRCVMATQAVEEVPADRGVMRTLVREARHIAGVYGIVITPGAVDRDAVVELS